ncbi:hypothetical protein Tco_0617967 [Tanacetum coccineum]
MVVAMRISSFVKMVLTDLRKKIVERIENIVFESDNTRLLDKFNARQLIGLGANAAEGRCGGAVWGSAKPASRHFGVAHCHYTVCSY